MKIKLNTAVYCHKDFCGVVSNLIVDPTGQYLTRLVVKSANLPELVSRAERLVPLSQIANMTSAGLWLKCDVDEYCTLSLFSETHFKQVSRPDGTVLEYDFLPSWSSKRDLMYVAVIKHNIFPGEFILSRQVQIETKNGHLGQFEGFIVQPETGKITHLVFQWGHIWEHPGKTVPASLIETIDQDTIYLNINRSDLIHE